MHRRSFLPHIASVILVVCCLNGVCGTARSPLNASIEILVSYARPRFLKTEPGIIRGSGEIEKRGVKDEDLAGLFGFRRYVVLELAMKGLAESEEEWTKWRLLGIEKHEGERWRGMGLSEWRMDGM